ncbi:hypothetical protein ATCC90586_008956 [Pythium insidiosum]|nr:hypothetical protein ATCC90586_008956 [Pythium insidiosum]
MLFVLPCFLVSSHVLLEAAVEASRRNDLDRGIAMLSCLGEILSTAAADLPAMYGSVLDLLFRHYGQCRRDPIIPCQMVVLHVIMCHRGNSADDHHLSSHRERTRLSLQVLQFLTHAVNRMDDASLSNAGNDNRFSRPIEEQADFCSELQGLIGSLSARQGFSQAIVATTCLYVSLVGLKAIYASNASILSTEMATQTLLPSITTTLSKRCLPPALHASALAFLDLLVSRPQLLSDDTLASVDVVALCTFVRASDQRLSFLALQVFRRILRLPALRSRVETGLLAGDDPERSMDDTAILKTVDFVKELVYALDARAEVLEASVGVLAHLAKSDCLHRMLLRMRELPTAAVFIEDPYSLLSAFSPSTHTGVLHRQCRFLERLVACGESRLLVASKRGALLCFSKALGVPDDSIRASAANGLALVSTAVGSDRLPIEAREQLSQAIHFIFEHDDCRLLKECHAALHDCARALQDEASRRHIKLIVALAEVFENVTSSKGIAPMQAVIGSRLTQLPKTLVKLLSLDAIHTDAFAPDKPWPRLHLVRVLRRLVKDAQVAAQFRDHNLAHMSEPFDLLIQQLHPLRVAAVTRNKAGDAYVLELLRVLIRLTEDPQVCDVVTSRADALDILFFYFRSPTFSHSLHLVWVIVQNLATNAVHVIDLVERLTTPQRVLVLTNEVKWDDDSCALAATIVQAALALALGHAGVNSLLLKYVPAFSAMLLSEAVRLWDSSVLERLTLVLAHIIGACSRQLDVFTQVLALIERILYLCELYGEVAAPKEARHERGSLEWTNGMRTAVERLISALCDLLLLFHEDEARRTVFPGYALTLRLRPRVAPRAVAIARRRGTEKRRLGTTAWRLTLRCKRTGVFCEGFSPETDEMLDQVLRILTAACTFRVFREAKRSRSGTVVACGNCVVYVANFFFHLSQTVSGRFMFMNPRVIEFWKRLVPTMDKFSLLKLAQALDECVLSKDQVGSFLTSGALSLLVAATLKVVKDAAKSVQGDATGVSWQRVPPGQSAAVAFDAFLQFVIGAAVLTERSQFLQSTYFLVHTGAKNGISVAGVVVAAIVFSKGSAPYLPLACKVLSRFLCVFTLHEAAEFLRSCPVQIARGLGWLIDEKDVMEALLTTIKHTEPEALMKSRILVRVVHSTLLRTAILGLIDKGVPEVLHHNSLKLMAAHMERLLACSQTADVSSPILGSRAEDSTPPNARQPRGNAAVFKPVERLAAGIHAVGGAANLLFTNTIAGLDDDDEAEKGTADLAACVRALRAVVEETAVFTSDNYKRVFKRFEENNDDLELVAAMESCSQAILFVQGLFYASEIIREAVFSAIWDDYDRGADHPVVNPTSRALCDEASEAVGVFLLTVERILEWIAISLQNSEMDSLYYGHKLQNLLKLASELLLLPLEILDTEESTDRDTEMADAGSVSSQALVSRAPVRTHRLVDDYPVYLRFRCLELRSWLWSVLGFLPYLCVRHEDKFRIVQFRQTTNDRAPDGSWYGGMFREYSCSFEAVDAGHDHVKTSYRELPHAVDVEIWMYLPFWYRDVLISQAKVPLLSIAIGLDEFDFQFYPLSSRGVRSYQPDVVATLKMTLLDREGAREDTAIEAIASEFPAYSTAGSRVLRRFLRKISSRVYSWVSSLGGQVASAVKMDRFLPSSTSNHRNVVGVLGVTQTTTPASPSMRDSILECVRKIKQELEDAILPDKLLGSYEKHNAAEQCALLMTQLDEATPRFVDALTRSRERVPEWHSFERMLAPTTLNHFLIQPMERLQFYCAVHQYLDSQLTSKDVANITAADSKFPSLDGVASASHSSSARLNGPAAGPSSPRLPYRGLPLARVLSDVSSEVRQAALVTAGKLGSFSWKKVFHFSEQARVGVAPSTARRDEAIADFNELEELRVRRLLKYHAMDPFDAAARLKRLYQDARSLPAALYREGITATVVHWSLWLLLSLTIWRISIAKDAVRDSIKSFGELYHTQQNDEELQELLQSIEEQQTKTTAEQKTNKPQKIIISDRNLQHHLHHHRGHLQVEQPTRAQVMPEKRNASSTAKRLPDFIMVSQRELRQLVVLLEVKSLIADVFRIWPSENGNIGLGGFWSSFTFTALAIGSPIACIYLIFPWLLSTSVVTPLSLSYVVCAYAALWIGLALFSIRRIANEIPTFREVRRVDSINLTTFPYCIRNYMAIGSVIWEGFQLNTTSFSVWKQSYKPKQLAALTTIDLQDLGLGFVQVNVFMAMQVASLLGLGAWFFCLKASNNKQFYLSAACYRNGDDVVLRANEAIHCWTPEHRRYALQGMFGMSIFVPVAVLAYGSYQVFFPEVNLDVQTSPVLNVNSQIVKAAMMGALTFFMKQVVVFLVVALLGNLRLFVLVTRNEYCSTWHLKYTKAFIYAISTFSALCALWISLPRAEEPDLH